MDKYNILRKYVEVLLGEDRSEAEIFNYTEKLLDEILCDLDVTKEDDNSLGEDNAAEE